MTIRAEAWNVLVIGAWNTAILTPNGISSRLLQLPAGVPVEVQVAIDRPAPIRVIHDNIVIVPAAHALEVAPRIMNPVTLQQAADIAKRALFALPETPVTAAGINIRYHCNELPDPLMEKLRTPIDDFISDVGHSIIGRSTQLSLRHEDGALNLEITQDATGGGLLAFNFELVSSQVEPLSRWLSTARSFYETSSQIMSSLDLSVEHLGGPSD